MAKIRINDEELDLVSGGVLKEGWDMTLLSVMGIYKGLYEEEGLQKVKDLMALSLDDPTSPIEPQDLDKIYNFIDENWADVAPIKKPAFKNC